MADIKLGERLFTVANLDAVTVDHHLAQLAEISRAGLDRLLPAEGETPEAFYLRVHAALLTSGRATDLVALYLLPLGAGERDWRAETSAEIRRYIGQLDTVADRELVYQLVLEFVFGFFRRGAASLLTSLRSIEGIPAAEPGPGVAEERSPLASSHH